MNIVKNAKNEVAKVVVDEETFLSFTDMNQGLCLACGTVADGVEPDATRYTCEHCLKPRVYGFEELLLMGRVDIAEY